MTLYTATKRYKGAKANVSDWLEQAHACAAGRDTCEHRCAIRQGPGGTDSLSWFPASRWPLLTSPILHPPLPENVAAS